MSYGTSAWTAGGDTWGGTVFPDGTPHHYQFDYDPNQGNGLLTLSWDGVQILSRELEAGHRSQGAVFNRFGIFSNQLPGVVAGNTTEAYFDDIQINGTAHDFTVDPAWEGIGNETTFEDPALYGTNDFGFSASNFAGGASPGELGGLMWRVEDSHEDMQAYYADDVGTLTLENHLSASGKMSAKRFTTDSGVMIGWFNSAEQDWPPSNFVGVYMDSLSDTGRLFSPMYGTSAGSTAFAHAPWLLFPPDGTPLDWTIDYDPDASGGQGAITVTLNGVTRTLLLDPGHKAEGAVLDRFGIFNMQDNNGKHSVVYFDDLTYTSANAALLPGDVTGDGWIGGADLTAVITNWGRTGATHADGDLSGDGTVSGPDYTEVITYWGTGTPPPPEPGTIPEPATLGLLLIGGLALLRKRY